MQRFKPIYWQYYLLFFLNALIIFILIFRQGIICGWDLQFHLNRIEELHYSLLSGHLLASNGSFTFSKIGLAVSTFYPYLFLYPFAIMRSLINPVIAYNVCLFFLTLLSFIVSYKAINNFPSQNRHTESGDLGFLFSLIYNNSGYLLLQFTQRGDIPEYIALIFLPLLLMGLLSLLKQPNSKKWLWMPITFVFIVYSHLLSAFIFTLFIIVILCLNYRQLDKIKLKKLLLSGVIILGCTLPITLNIIISNHNNKIVAPIVPDTLQNEALKSNDLLINSLANLVPGPLSTVNLGFVVLICTFISLFILRGYNSLGRQLAVIGLFALILSTNLFPWFIFQHTPLHIIQFPWRFLGIATFCIAYDASWVLQPLINKRGILFLIFITINFITFNYIHNYVHNGNQIIAYKQIRQYRKMATDAVYTDYMPEQTLTGMDKATYFRKKSDIHRHVAVINGHKVKLFQQQIKPGYNRISYTLTSLKPDRINYVTLPLLNYGNNHASHGITAKQTSRGTTMIAFIPKSDKQVVTIYLH
ncbi:hypothetical protein [Limosilactobacillus frumenti]|nr:hypothetical protein [Limosilactobacillus frumenti]MBA2914756.1 hypothetical protein [Limosilactobacillus frumenti]QFG72943.1 hypothetical protein LF145_06265 [Limosilactobacillus frumenti]